MEDNGIKTYLDNLDLEEGFAVSVLSAAGETIGDKHERMLMREFNRPELIRKAVKYGLPIPQGSEQRDVFEAKEELLMLTTSILEEGDEVRGLAKYYSGDKKFYENGGIIDDSYSLFFNALKKSSEKTGFSLAKASLFKKINDAKGAVDESTEDGR